MSKPLHRKIEDGSEVHLQVTINGSSVVEKGRDLKRRLTSHGSSMERGGLHVPQ
jgi:hypothetical protein